jgi:hypothetical protein
MGMDDQGMDEPLSLGDYLQAQYFANKAGIALPDPDADD